MLHFALLPRKRLQQGRNVKSYRVYDIGDHPFHNSERIAPVSGSIRSKYIITVLPLANLQTQIWKIIEGMSLYVDTYEYSTCRVLSFGYHYSGLVTLLERIQWFLRILKKSQRALTSYHFKA